MTDKDVPTTPHSPDAILQESFVKGRRASKKGVRTRDVDTEIALVVADERNRALPPVVDGREHPADATRETLAEQGLPGIPGELAPPPRRHLTLETPNSPMSDDHVHQTESKIHHPLGKTRNGVRQRGGK